MKIYVVKTTQLEYNDEEYYETEGVCSDTPLFINRTKAEEAAKSVLRSYDHVHFDGFQRDYEHGHGYDERQAIESARKKLLGLVNIDVYDMQEDLETSQLIKLETITFTNYADIFK
jgi:hypothetical protein